MEILAWALLLGLLGVSWLCWRVMDGEESRPLTRLRSMDDPPGPPRVAQTPQQRLFEPYRWRGRFADLPPHDPVETATRLAPPAADPMNTFKALDTYLQRHPERGRRGNPTLN